MFYNNLKIAFRNIRRNKLFSFINILGLAMGIAAFILLIEYISQEKSVNKFHANLPNMYRLINQGPDSKYWPEVEPGWALKAKAAFPEIKEYCRFAEGISNGIVVNPNSKNRESFRETNTVYADGNFFTFFSFPLKSGNVNSLKQSNIVFISASSAKKYFANEDPIDQSLEVNNQFGNTTYTVGGVFEDMKDNSDLRYDMVYSLETLKNPANLNGNSWANTDNLSSQYIQTCFLLNNPVQLASLETKLTKLRNELKEDKDGINFKLQSFETIHLGKSLSDTYPTVANLKYIYMLGGISFLILLIAWFNYVNLSTANSFKRANEVGVRKVIGASRRSLVFQFMSESFLINLLGFIAAFTLVILLQPLFNKLIGKDLSLSFIGSSSLWVYALLLLMLGSVLSGAYTALAMSGFKPVDTLKGKISKTSKGIILRKSLVVAQFSISIVLIIATVLIYNQLNYMQTKKLGLNAEQLLVIRGPEVGKDSTYKQRKSAFTNQLAAESFVKDYCISGSIPSEYYNFQTSGFTQPASKKGDELKSYAFAIIGERFLGTYDIPLAYGRNFTAAETAVEWNDNNKVIVNEKAARSLGFENPADILHTKIQWDERALDVIGVVRDYHHMGVQKTIDPMIFYPQNNSAYFTVRLTPGDMKEKIAALGQLYKTNFSGNPFEYFFVDEHYNSLYKSEQQYAGIFTMASSWAIFIACLGLFGLTTFTVESRVKEIGVRKVLGASVSSIVSLLSKDFLILVCIAFLIASPIAWYFMQQWLQDFAYHINIGWLVFAIAGMTAISIALITISFQAIKAALANPVKSLRTE